MRARLRSSRKPPWDPTAPNPTPASPPRGTSGEREGGEGKGEGGKGGVHTDTEGEKQRKDSCHPQAWRDSEMEVKSLVMKTPVEMDACGSSHGVMEVKE